MDAPAQRPKGLARDAGRASHRDRAYRRTGKREQARDHLTTAVTALREMGMTDWLAKAEAEMKELA